VGEARLSPGFELPARHVISTVGPVWHGGGEGEAELLAACYLSCLDLARTQGLRSIAFPAISTGVYAYPREEAASIAVAILKAQAPLFDRLIACCFDDAQAEVYRRLL
jgi:O-acetyl-ADP-ribose deacetylase (regulator of RNase III)